MKTLSASVLLLSALLLSGCDRPAERPIEPVVATAPVSIETTLDVSSMLDAAIAGDQRSRDNRTRDIWRNPKETLLFFGLRHDMTVVEIYPGGGWYTEILAPVLAEHGQLVAAHFDPAVPPAYRERSFTSYVNLLASNVPLYGKVEVLELGEPDSFSLGADGSADMVVTFRNIHGLINDGALEAMLAATFRVLKPGGILGVVQHRANEGVDPIESARLGYVPESYVIQQVEAAGLMFVESSEINANPSDTKDYDIGVWALPPSLRGELDMRPARMAIGESDRMTLKFVKPAER